MRERVAGGGDIFIWRRRPRGKILLENAESSRRKKKREHLKEAAGRPTQNCRMALPIEMGED